MDTRKWKRIHVLAVTALMAGSSLLTACGSGSASASASDDLVAHMKSSKVITIGTSNDAPWSTVTASGEAAGIIPDVLRAYIKRAGLGDVKIKSTAMPFDSLIPSVSSGRIQVIGDAIFNTAERQKQVQFTRTIFYNAEGMVVAKGNPKNISSIADLCGHVGATYKGTSWVQDLQNASKKCSNGSITVKTYDTVDQVMQDIANGRVDGGLIDSSIAAYAVGKNPNLKIELAPGYTPLDRSSSANALALSLKDKTFVKSFDKYYTEMLADGTVAKIFEQNGLKQPQVFLP
jgi:polar amino acid transport system substrate-binding protein